jgi:rare lipoprotein A
MKTFSIIKKLNTKSNYRVMKQKFTSLFLFAFFLSAPLFSQSIVNSVEAGTALYYADYLEGRRTASGEVFSQAEMTCAHKSFPFGTWLRVTRLDNQRSVTVKVNDRGPFCDGCVVDLSKAAAAQIDLLQAGRAEVKVEALGVSQPAVAQNNPAELFTARGGTNATPESFSTINRAVPRSYNSVPQSYSTVPQSYSSVPRQTTSRIITTSKGGDALTGWEQELRSKSSSQVRPRTYSYTSPTLASRAGVNSGSVRERTTAARTTPTTGSASWTPNLAIKGVAPATTVPTNVPSSFNNVSPRIQAGYGVQLASYANYDNADKRQRTVYSQGVTNVFIKQGVSKSGAQVFRVVVGPFSDQQTASQSLQQIKRTYALKGFVVNLQK